MAHRIDLRLDELPMEEMEGGQIGTIVSFGPGVDKTVIGDVVLCAWIPYSDELEGHCFVSLKDGGYYRPDESRINVRLIPPGTKITIRVGSPD